MVVALCQRKKERTGRQKPHRRDYPHSPCQKIIRQLQKQVHQLRHSFSDESDLALQLNCYWSDGGWWLPVCLSGFF